MSVLRFQQPCSPCADRRGTVFARLCPRNRNHCGAHSGPGSVIDFPGRRHALADAAADRRCHPRCDRPALARRTCCRSHAGSQSDQRRGDALCRLPRRRRQPGFARRAGAGRCVAERAGTAAHRARGARCGRDCAQRVRSLFVRSDLRPSRSDAANVGGGVEARDLGSRRASVALSADHRGGHAVLRASRRRQIEDAGRGDGARAVRRHPGGLRRAWIAGLRDFQPRAIRRGMPAQSGVLARRGICRHRSGRAWPPRYRRDQARDRDREAARSLADARRSHGSWCCRPTTSSTAKSVATSSC